MPRYSLITQGPLLAALVCLTACARPDQPQPYEPRTLASAAQSLRTGDIDRLLADQGKGPGLSDRATELALELDPEAWLVAMGASSREHDLAKAASAMNTGDDAALAEAIGFGHQQLGADVLSGGGSIYSRRADGRNYYEEGPQPIDLINGFLTPALPTGALAIETTVWGRLGERQFKVVIGLDSGGVNCLSATLDLAASEVAIPGAATRHEEAGAALPATGLLAQLDLSSLNDARWLGASFVLIREDGGMERARMARDGTAWALVEHSADTLQERLGIQRDERLEFLRLRTTGYERVQGRWPRGLHEISFKPWQAVDPVAPSGRLGWADHDKKPPVNFELAATGDADYTVICTHITNQGRRAITRDGAYTWIK